MLLLLFDVVIVVVVVIVGFSISLRHINDKYTGILYEEPFVALSILNLRYSYTLEYILQFCQVIMLFNTTHQ